MDTLADAVASLELDDNESLPYGGSHWDRKPAELHAMILKAAGPLTLLVNGLLRNNRRLDRATVEALWTDAISTDWQGDLRQLPNIYLRAGEVKEYERPALDMLSLSVSRSMFDRLCARFPDPTPYDDFDAQHNQYQAHRSPLVKTIPFKTTCLRHIPMRNCWFDLVDFSYPIALGWWSIKFGHTGLLSHLAEHHGVDLGKFQRCMGLMSMDLAAEHGHLDVVQMLHKAGNTSCSDEAMGLAAGNGHLDLVKWLHANRTEGCTTLAIDWAAEKGHLEIVQFLLACGYEFTFDALCDAEDDAIVDVLLDSMTLARAMEMLEMARSHGRFSYLVERLELAVAAKQA